MATLQPAPQPCPWQWEHSASDGTSCWCIRCCDRRRPPRRPWLGEAPAPAADPASAEPDADRDMLSEPCEALPLSGPAAAASQLPQPTHAPASPVARAPVQPAPRKLLDDAWRDAGGEAREESATAEGVGDRRMFAVSCCASGCAICTASICECACAWPAAPPPRVIGVSDVSATCIDAEDAADDVAGAEGGVIPKAKDDAGAA